jgi:hypothetical protein
LDYCESCKKIQEQTGKKENCPNCEYNRPDLIPENQEAWELWIGVGTQWRAGAFSLVGLDYNALYLVADTLLIDMTPAMLYKIQFLEHQSLKKIREGAK